MGSRPSFSFSEAQCPALPNPELVGLFRGALLRKQQRPLPAVGIRSTRVVLLFRDTARGGHADSIRRRVAFATRLVAHAGVLCVVFSSPFPLCAGLPRVRRGTGLAQ